jgi:hypothetical protein
VENLQEEEGGSFPSQVEAEVGRQDHFLYQVGDREKKGKQKLEQGKEPQGTESREKGTYKR